MARGKYIQMKAGLDGALDPGDVEALREEMVEWRDNMEGNDMTHLPKFDEVQECADMLDVAELDEKVQALAEACQEAEEGRAAIPACEHVVGTRCKRCSWSGKLERPRAMPTLEEDLSGEEDLPFCDPEPPVARVWAGGAMCYYNTRERARRYWWRETEIAVRLNAGRATPPRNKAYVEEVPPVEAFDLQDISWREFRRYGKQALNLSRAYRFSNAVSGITAGVEAVEAALAKCADDAESPLLEAVREKLAEVQSALEEVDGIDFPGMF